MPNLDIRYSKNNAADRIKLTVLTVLSVIFLDSSNAFAQKPNLTLYNVDPTTERFRELEIGFQVMFGELMYSQSQNKSVFSNHDKSLIENAIHKTPYYQESTNMMVDACDQFDSSDSDEVDVHQIAGVLADANYANYSGKETYLEFLYSSFSDEARARFNELVEANTRSVSSMETRARDYVRMAEEESRESMFEFLDQVCSRLPMVIEQWGGGESELIITPIELQGDVQ